MLIELRPGRYGRPRGRIGLTGVGEGGGGNAKWGRERALERLWRGEKARWMLGESLGPIYRKFGGGSEPVGRRGEKITGFLGCSTKLRLGQLTEDSTMVQGF